MADQGLAEQELAEQGLAERGLVEPVEASVTGDRNGASRARPRLRVPPHNLVAEESLLGAMLLTSDALVEAFEVVEVEHFYRPAHARVFEAIRSLYNNGESVDAVTVAESLERSQALEAVGGLDGLLKMQLSTPASSNASSYARIVRDNFILRRLIECATEIADKAYGRPDDVGETVDWAENLVYQIAQGHITDSAHKLEHVLNEALDRLDELYNRGTNVTGTPTGFKELDSVLAGLQPSGLYVVGARPSMGKTALALGMVQEVAFKAKRPVLMFSLEMSHFEIAQRLLSAQARIDSSKLRTGNLSGVDWQRISEVLARIGDAPLWIDDNPNLTVMDIRARARRLAGDRSVGNLALIVVDYLQLMTGRLSADNRQVEVAEISRGLKVLAREMKCPVVALSQLSRGLETRKDKRPQLADLRESGAIEQDADVVLFIYREEVYTPDNLASAGLADIIVAKNRHGPTASCKLAFVPRYVTFADGNEGGESL